MSAFSRKRVLKVGEADLQRAVRSAIQSKGRGQAVRRGGAAPAPQEVKRAEEGGFSYTRLIRSMAMNDSSLAPYEQGIVQRQLGEDSATAGGFLVPEEQSMEIIDLLRARSVIRNTAARVIPMSSNTLTIPKQTGGATAYWIGENSAITASEQTFGQLRLVARKLVAMTKISNELLADSSPSVEALVRGDIAQVLALAEDDAYLEGSGVSNEPRGIRNSPNVTTTSLGANGATPDFDDLYDAMNRLETANVFNATDWIVHPRTKNTLRKLKDGDGRYLYESNVAVGEPDNLLGYPVRKSNQISIAETVGGTTDNSWIVFGDFNEAIIGQRMQLEIQASAEAGTAFENDQTWVRAVMRVDFALRQEAAFEIITGVRP